MDFAGGSFRGNLPSKRIEVRAGDSGKTITGYSSVFNVWYSVRDLFGPFQERVAKRAFEKTLSDGSEKLGLFNHDPNYPLGNTAAGTMRNRTDDTGLIYEIDVDPESPNAKTALVAVERGDVRGASFAFETVRDRWDFDHDSGEEFRTLLEVRLFEHGPVTNPANPSSTAEVQRSAEEITEAELRSTAIKIRRGMPLTAGDFAAINADPHSFQKILYGLAPVADSDHPRPDTRSDEQAEALFADVSSRLTLLGLRTRM